MNELKFWKLKIQKGFFLCMEIFFWFFWLNLPCLDTMSPLCYVLWIQHSPIPTKRSLGNFVRLVKTVTEMVTGCLRMMESCHICIRWIKSISSLLWKIWDSVYICHRLLLQENVLVEWTGSCKSGLINCLKQSKKYTS